MWYNGWFRIANRRQKELNDELDSYITKRRKYSGYGVGSFFKKVESLVPSSSKPDTVEDVSETDSVVYDKPKRRFSLFSLFSRGSSRKEDYDDSESSSEPEFVEKQAEEIEHDIEELGDDDADDYRRQSLFERLFSLFRRPVQDDEDDISQEKIEESLEQQREKDGLYNETRETLKVLHKWLDRLPPQQIEAFKRSPDFHRYKQLLDRYNLIK